MVGKNENIFVETDYQNIVVIDPNKVYDNTGVLKERLVKHEELVMYANLTVKEMPRTRLLQNPDGLTDVKDVSIAEINYLKPTKDTEFFTTNYTDSFLGLNLINNGKPNQELSSNLLLISSIDTEIRQSYNPVVTIVLQDIRGRALFEQGTNSPYNVFFTIPRPVFLLTLKGWYGKAVTYKLQLSQWDAQFDSATGNFKITAKFLAYTLGVLNNVNMQEMNTIPYMYRKAYQITPTTNVSSVPSSNTNGGSDTVETQKILTTLGYEKLKDVYADYKAQNLIPKDFPEMGMKVLINKLNNLEKNLSASLPKQIMTSITDYESYNNTLNSYLKDIYSQTPKSWFYENIDTDNFLILSNGDYIFTLKKGILESDNKDIKVKDLEGIINKYNKQLKENSTFGADSKDVIVGDKTFSNLTIPNNIRLSTIQKELDSQNIDWDKTLEKRTGIELFQRTTKEKELNNAVFFGKDVIKLNPDLVLDLEVLKLNAEKLKNYWFKFEGGDSFVNDIIEMQKQLQTDLDELQTAIGKFLSILIEDYKYLGFKPLFKNIVAVIMANTEAFLRLMSEVHDKAWAVKYNDVRQKVILRNYPNVGADTKSFVTPTTPVYPWPEYFTSDVNKNEYIEKYPGNVKELAKTIANNKTIWPEVEFVEEFIKAYRQTKENVNSDLDSIQSQNTVNRVSYSALDFPPSNVIYGNQKTPEILYELIDRPYVYGNYCRLFKKGYENSVYEVLSEAEFSNLQNSISQDSPAITKLLKNFAFKAANYLVALRNFSNSGTGESWQKYINNIFVTDYLQNEVNNSFGIYDMDSVSLSNGLITTKPNNLNKLKEMVTSKNINTFDFLDTEPFNLPDWYKTNLADGNAATSSNIYNTSKTYFIHDVKSVISNFNISTKITEIRPVTSFRFYTPTQPTIESSTAASFKSFYKNRTGDSNINNLQMTEGTVNYANYYGNISSTQTTSILNTPFFVNSIIEGVNKLKINDENPFTTSAYLFLNSLPLSTLREKYKSFDSTTNTTSDLDYIFASLKKFGAIHRLPYAWILKYGSIWYRYKKYYVEGVDILDNIWSNFDSVNQFDPITNNKTTTYSLLTPNTIGLNSIVLENVAPTAGGSLTFINNGFYPQLINTFNYFYRGSDMFSAYTNDEIQSKINSATGITINSASDATINLEAGYSTTEPTDSLLYKTWSCTIKDSNKGYEYIVPSFGYLINQAKYECLNNNNIQIQPFISNYAIYNGGVRCLWALPNYGYYDIDQTKKPTPNNYFKKILSGQSQQEAFSIQSSNDYATIEELLSVFNIDILNYFETEFLKFSQSSTNFLNNINNIKSNSDVTFRNFQVLMTEMMKVNYVDETINSNSRIKELMSFQFLNFNSLIKNFMQYDVIFKYGNPSNFNRNLFSIMTNEVLNDKHNYGYYVNGSLPTNTNTTNSLEYYISLNPLAWISLFSNVGISSIDGIKYSKSGSTVTDFFPDMNIEFTKENVDKFAPMIKIYSTRKILNQNYGKTSFKNELDNHQSTMTNHVDNTLDSILSKARTNLPDVSDITPITDITTALNGETLKFDWWKKFKYLNDEFIAGSDYKKMLLFNDIMFLDVANRDVSDVIFFNPIKVRENLNSSYKNEMYPVYGLLTNLASENGFYFMNSPAYINWYNSPNQLDSNNSENVANTIFGTYMNVDVRQSKTKLIFTYAQENSKYLDIKSNNYDYQDDSFDLANNAKNTLIDNNLNKEDIDLEKSNKVVGFNVDIGDKNQNIFPDIQISMNEGLDTFAGAQTTAYLINQENGTQVGTQSQSLYTYYRNKSYNCVVKSMGNVMIQPTMYFNLRYVPLFSGTYRIESVKHNIQPGKFETEFKGVRLRVLSPPKVENYLQMFFKQLYLDLVPSIRQYIDTNKKDNTVLNSNPNSIQSTTTNNQLTNNSEINPNFNSGSITNSQSAQESLAAPYVQYISINPTQTTVSPDDIATGIKTSLFLPQTNSANNSRTTLVTNLTNTKVITFITMYLESYKNNQFTTYNNNFGGAKLNYSYAGNLSNFFKNEYIGRLNNNNGKPYPYAVFNTYQDMIGLLIAKWSPRSTTFTLNSESIAKAWVTNWAALFAYGKRMTDDEYSSYISGNPNTYKYIINRINEGLDLAKNLGLIDIYT